MLKQFLKILLLIGIIFLVSWLIVDKKKKDKIKETENTSTSGTSSGSGDETSNTTGTSPVTTGSTDTTPSTDNVTPVAIGLSFEVLKLKAISALSKRITRAQGIRHAKKVAGVTKTIARKIGRLGAKALAKLGVKLGPKLSSLLARDASLVASVCAATAIPTGGLGCLAAISVSALTIAYEVLSFYLDFTNAGGYSTLGSNQLYKTQKELYLYEHIESLNQINLPYPIFAGPLENYSGDDETQFVEDINTLITSYVSNPADTSLKALTEAANAQGFTDEADVTLFMLNNIDRYVDYDALMKRATKELCTQKGGQWATVPQTTAVSGPSSTTGQTNAGPENNRFTEGCSWPQNQCQSNWPLTDSDETYVEWDSENNACVVSPYGPLRESCDTNGANYNLQNRQCTIDRNYCIQKGADWGPSYPDKYGRGAGYTSEAACNSHANSPSDKYYNGGKGCEKSALLWYPKCKDKFKSYGCCLCVPDKDQKGVDDCIISTGQELGEWILGETIFRDMKLLFEQETKPAECPPGYTNTGLTCFRPMDSIPVPSSVANCPAGFTNNGATCGSSRDYRHPSILRPCTDGYTNIGAYCSKGLDLFSESHWGTCPSNYFLGELGLRCFYDCEKAYGPNYYNTGDYCTPKVLGMESMTCPNGYFRTGARCYKHCDSGYRSEGEFCTRPADSLPSSSMGCFGDWTMNEALGRCVKNVDGGASVNIVNRTTGTLPLPITQPSNITEWTCLDNLSDGKTAPTRINNGFIEAASYDWTNVLWDTKDTCLQNLSYIQNLRPFECPKNATFPDTSRLQRHQRGGRKPRPAVNPGLAWCAAAGSDLGVKGSTPGEIGNWKCFMDGDRAKAVRNNAGTVECASNDSTNCITYDSVARCSEKLPILNNPLAPEKCSLNQMLQPGNWCHTAASTYGPSAITTNWVCFNNIGGSGVSTPIRYKDGNLQCMSSDGINCEWGSQNNCINKAVATPNSGAVTCNSEMYGNPDHWCAKALPKYDITKESIIK